jgi:hypothetical protein
MMWVCFSWMHLGSEGDERLAKGEDIDSFS